MNISTGTLFIVSTPLGNPDDITLRALKALKQCDIVVCEEIKEGARLLHEYHISKKIELLNEHNESEQTTLLLALLKEGKNLAMISDCGTPLLADPGRMLVQAALAETIPVIAVPGASSILTALVTSGMPTQQFLYAGFLSREPQERRDQLKQLARETRTVVLLETPYRLLPLLQALAEILPHRKAYLGCNLTLPSETHHYGTSEELLAKFEQQKFKGEFVLCFEGADSSAAAEAVSEEGIVRPVRRTIEERGRKSYDSPRAPREGGERRPFRKTEYGQRSGYGQKTTYRRKDEDTKSDDRGRGSWNRAESPDTYKKRTTVRSDDQARPEGKGDAGRERKGGWAPTGERSTYRGRRENQGGFEGKKREESRGEGRSTGGRGEWNRTGERSTYRGRRENQGGFEGKKREESGGRSTGGRGEWNRTGERSTYRGRRENQGGFEGKKREESRGESRSTGGRGEWNRTGERSTYRGRRENQGRPEGKGERPPKRKPRS